MNEPTAISVRGVSKRYHVFENQRARLFHALWPRYRANVQQVWALSDVNFDIRRGESVAIIGRNGSGKSTLLEILTGTLTPTSGETHVDGRVSALLELGSGFNPEYTGRDNVIFNGLLLGLTRKEILRRFDEIIAFADIGDVLERPVKTYSSGMMMRLAFAVQVLCEPDILIIDEALSVGDFFFQQKCLGYIRSLCEKGVTLLFVSHDMGTVRDLCSRALYLRNGQIQFDGVASEAIRCFLSERTQSMAPSQPASAVEAGVVVANGRFSEIYRDALWRSGTGEVEKTGRILAIAAYDESGQACTTFKIGSRMKLVVAYNPDSERECHVTIEFLNKYRQISTVTGSYHLNCSPPLISEDQVVSIFEIDIAMLLEAGNYSFNISTAFVTGTNRGELIDTATAIGPVSIVWDYESEIAPFLGQVGLPASGSFTLAKT